MTHHHAHRPSRRRRGRGRGFGPVQFDRTPTAEEINANSREITREGCLSSPVITTTTEDQP